MSGDVQPRKRNKDKRFKKKESNLSDIHLPQKSVKKDDDLDFDETNIHVQKDIKFGGNIISKVFFSLVFGALICMVGIIVLEHRGTGNEVQSSSDSPWSQMLEGWIEDKPDAHDDVAHDHEDEEEEEEGHDHDEEDHDLHDEDDDHDSEDHDAEDHDTDLGDDHDEASSEDHDENDEHSEEHETQDDDNDEAGIFSGFVQKYIRPSPEEEEIDEEGVFTGFINKYIYTSEAAARDKKEREDEEEQDEGYDTDDDENARHDDDDEDLDHDSKHDEADDQDEDDDQNEDDEHETQEEDEDVKDEANARRYSVAEDNDDVSRELDEDDEAGSKEEEDQVTEDWRKIVYRAPAPEEEEDDDDDVPSYESYHHKEKEDDRGIKDKSESWERDAEDSKEDKEEDDGDDGPDDLDDDLTEPDEESDKADDEETPEEEEGAGIAVKFSVGVALIVVAHVVLVKKWKDNTEPVLAPSAPLPPTSQEPHPVYVEEISSPLPPVEEEPPPPLDRRATLVEPGEVSLPSDVEESDFGEYEEEEEEESQQSDVEPTRESTLVTYEYSPVDTEQEEEEEEEKSDNDSAPINDKWAGISRSPQEFNSEDEEEGVSGSDLEYSDNEPLPVVPQPRYGGPKSVDEDYLLADITNDEDWAIRRELDAAEALYNGSKLEQALSAFRALSSAHPRSPRSLYGVAKSLDALAEVKQSNAVLESAIDAYLSVLTQASKVPGALLIQAAQRCIDRGRFKGSYQRIIPAHQHLINKFPDDPKHRNDLAVTYLMMARNTRARAVLEEVLTRWPRDGMAHASLGFILKSEGQHEAAVSHLLSGIHTGEFAAAVQPQNQGKYYYVLGDALQRLGRSEEAYKVYSEAAVQGLFKSAYQRSVHNVDRLAAKPWWSLDETTYLPFFSKLERNWKKIRDEAQAILKMKDKSVGFQDEAETLVRSGDWKQFQLFVRGRKIEANCKRTPSTCRLISEFLPAASCSRGQAKLSVIHPGTHVWPHCGPTNCRLRAHLGLVVPGNTALRVANETRSWEEGRVLVFDDSFEHEVWHNGSSYRLILIVDVWHPELTAAERKTLKPI